MKLSFYSDRQFQEWYDYPNNELYVPHIDLEKGVEILSVLEELEKMKPSISICSEQTKRFKFTKQVYKKACKKYPVTMERAKFVYFNQSVGRKDEPK